MSAPIASISTMWSQGRFKHPEREHDHMPSFAQTVARLGFSHVEINYVIPPAGVDDLIESEHVAFSSVHSPCPRIKMPDGRLSEAYNLGADDEEERRLAVEVARATVDTAVRANCKLMVVHLGGVGHEIFEEERKLRKMYDAGTKEGAEFEALGKAAAERRAQNKERFYPAARRSLAEIAEYAAKHGVTVGLENRYHFHEFPDPAECAELMADYPADVVGFWLDVGHAEVLDRLGLLPHDRWLNELGERCVGTHVHDVDGLLDHRAPGYGTADWTHYAAKLPADIPRVCEINQKTPEDQIEGAVPYLRSVGVLPAK